MRRRTRAGYVYPFGPQTTVGRIDQGQDFGGTGVIRAIGRAKVVKVGTPWPEEGGSGVLYRLLDGPAAGRYVYTYEGIKPSVRAGQELRAGQTIGSLIPGSSTGIEMGWAQPSGEPITPYNGAEDGTPMPGGKAFARFLSKLKGGSGAGGFPFKFKSAAERKKFEKIAAEEGGTLGSGLPFEKEFEENIGEPVNHTIESGADLTKAVLGALENPESLLLNIGLVGGGAFLVYYGAAHVLGVHKPVATPILAAAKGAP